jgi:hypothetical protein
MYEWLVEEPGRYIIGWFNDVLEADILPFTSKASGQTKKQVEQRSMLRLWKLILCLVMVSSEFFSILSHAQFEPMKLHVFAAINIRFCLSVCDSDHNHHIKVSINSSNIDLMFVDVGSHPH